MERRKTLTALATAAFALALVSGGAARADDVVILDSTVATLAPGAVLSDTKSVDIPAGEFVSLIMGSGETRLIKGPYSGQIGATGQVAKAGVAELTGARGGETKVLGAVRAPKWDIAD